MEAIQEDIIKAKFIEKEAFEKRKRERQAKKELRVKEKEKLDVTEAVVTTNNDNKIWNDIPMNAGDAIAKEEVVRERAGLPLTDHTTTLADGITCDKNVNERDLMETKKATMDYDIHDQEVKSGIVCSSTFKSTNYNGDDNNDDDSDDNFPPIIDCDPDEEDS
jgi:hypothetical protein